MASSSAGDGAPPVSPADLEREMYDAHGSLEGNQWGTRWPGMTYEQGVYSTLQWVLGRTASRPMGDH